jgi:hypothetical protein
LSNGGVQPSFRLRNFSGELIGLMPAAAIHFCSMSVTNLREWFDKNNPGVSFRFESDKLHRIITNIDRVPPDGGAAAR